MKHYTSLAEIHRDMDAGKINCVDLVKGYLNNIAQNKDLNAYVEVYEAEALDKAVVVDEKIKNNTAGKLAGMVVGLKDVLCHDAHGLQCGSKILNGFESQFNGTAVERLLAEDAIVIGRQNCDEFAMGSSNENSSFGPVQNAADPTRVPGGSSGGSAVGVQANTCLVSLGTDTGGSVRQPASFCGVLGLKPTYSRISRHGLAAYASSFDTIGIFSKSVEDNALMLEVIAGADVYDSTVSKKPVPTYTTQIDPHKKYKIAYIKEALDSDGLQPEVKDTMTDLIERLKNDGHEVEEVGFPMLRYALETYYILTFAEASSNLSRYDGVRFGHRSEKSVDLESMYKASRSEGFGKEVQKRIMLGTFVLSASYYDAYYTRAQKVRRLIRDELKALLSNHDFLVLPTAPTTAFKIGALTKNPLEMYLADLFTVPASVAGTPAISVPYGKDKGGMPIGVQAIANDFEESKLLSFSKYLMN